MAEGAVSFANSKSMREKGEGRADLETKTAGCIWRWAGGNPGASPKRQWF